LESERLRLSEAIAYGPDLVAIRRGKWKLVAARDGRPLALFDLERDPLESVDASGSAPDALAELVALARAWHTSGVGAAGDGGGAWADVDDTVRERLRDLGYTQ